MLPAPGCVFVYGVADPRTSEIRYVGKTRSALSRRLRLHFKVQECDASARALWFGELRAADVEPAIFVLEEVAEVDQVEAERFWIAYFRALGADLANGNRGGAGSDGRKVKAAAVDRRWLRWLREEERTAAFLAANARIPVRLRPSAVVRRRARSTGPAW